MQIIWQKNQRLQRKGGRHNTKKTVSRTNQRNGERQREETRVNWIVDGRAAVEVVSVYGRTNQKHGLVSFALVVWHSYRYCLVLNHRFGVVIVTIFWCFLGQGRVGLLCPTPVSFSLSLSVYLS